MTINEYLNGLPDIKSKNGATLRETMAHAVSVWTNGACVGYSKKAMLDANLTPAQIELVIENLNKAFSEYSIEEAETLLFDLKQA